MNTNTRNLERATGREVHLPGQQYLFFGGTAYYGLNTHPAFRELFEEGLARYGVNNGTSRHNNVQLGIYDGAESHAAAKFGFEEAIILSSGYLASQLAVRELSKTAEKLIYSPVNHPSLWVGERPVVPASFAAWASETVRRINDSDHDSFLVVSNTFDNVIPQRLDFSPFQEIDPGKQVHLVLDDSHGLGIFHPSETAVQAFHRQKPPHIRLTVVASMAKGLGVDAGIILGDQQTIARLRQTGIFIGASPPAPAFAYTFLHADHVYEQQWTKLQENIRFFAQQLPKAGGAWTYIPDFPVFYQAGVPLFNHLKANGVLISSFPYPHPTNPPIDRIVVSAAHQQEDLTRLITLLPPDTH